MTIKIELKLIVISKLLFSITTPFHWFILSRPEPHIQRAMGADDVSSLLYTLDLPLSSQDDHGILTFFEKELDKIRKNHNLPSLWCPESDVAVLIKLADGLWIYVDTVARFIGNPNSSGHTAQLNLCSISPKNHVWKIVGESIGENGYVLWPYNAPNPTKYCVNGSENLVAQSHNRVEVHLYLQIFLDDLERIFIPIVDFSSLFCFLRLMTHVFTTIMPHLWNIWRTQGGRRISAFMAMLCRSLIRKWFNDSTIGMR